MRTKTLSTLTLATALVASVTTGAQAAIVGNISFSNSFTGPQSSYVGTDLSSATSFTFASPLLNTGSTGDYLGVLGGSGAIVAPASIALGATTVDAPLPTFSFSSALFLPGTTPVDRFVFTPTSGLVTRTSDPNTLTFTFDGTVVDTTNVLSSSFASAIVNINQVGGPGNLIGLSGTLISPVNVATPVPESMPITSTGILLGLGALMVKKTRSTK